MKPDWIAVDWGTSNLRAWAMRGKAVLAEAQSEDGMGRLARDDFEPALLRLIGDWLGPGVMPVVACGMVGSRQGWQEAPYRAVPCAALQAGVLQQVKTQDPRISFGIAPGLKQQSPADVMRGEETQIAGAASLLGSFDGVFCLPGTHSKWVAMQGPDVARFRTFMTGEMFALLSEQSVLRHGMAEGWQDAAFAQAVSDAIAAPEEAMAGLFSLRAEGLLAGLAPEAARARLSGLLIGAEISAARPFWQGKEVALIGASRLAGLYARALAAQRILVRQLDGTSCTVAGLGIARGL